MSDASAASGRKAISDPVWKELFSRSGNMCFMDGCSSPLFDLSGLKDVFIAHIKGVGEKGPRHDPFLEESELNAINNLLLLCNKHHNQIDAMPVQQFTVEKVRQIKQTHEDLVRSFASQLQNYVFDNSNKSVDTSSFAFDKWLAFLGLDPKDEMERTAESELMRAIVGRVGLLPPDARKVLSTIVRFGTPDKNQGDRHLSIRVELLFDRARPTPRGLVSSQLATLAEAKLCELDDPDSVPEGTPLRVWTRTQGDWDPFAKLQAFCKAEGFRPSELFENDRWELLN